MKQYIYQMIILAVSTCLWSCQDDDPTPTVVEEPDWKLELVENDPEPEWEMPESGIYQFSMTGIMKLSDFLEGYADETDEVSAFIGNECRGVVKAQEYNGEKLFFLYIRGNSAEKQKVTLKYYSAKNKNYTSATNCSILYKTAHMAKFPIQLFLRSKNQESIRKQ